MKHDSRWATAVNEASELYQRIDDLEKELAKANERADTNHESFVKIFAASRSKDAIIAGLNQKVVSVNERAEQAEADARALAQRVFETEILTDSEIEIVARYVPREQMEGAGYK